MASHLKPSVPVEYAYHQRGETFSRVAIRFQREIPNEFAPFPSGNRMNYCYSTHTRESKKKRSVGRSWTRRKRERACVFDELRLLIIARSLLLRLYGRKSVHVDDSAVTFDRTLPYHRFQTSSPWRSTRSSVAYQWSESVRWLAEDSEQSRRKEVN